MTETPLSIRLTTETKTKFQELAKTSGLKNEDFVSSLISTYESETETPANSAEKKQVRKALSNVQRLVEAVIDRALTQETHAKEEITGIKESQREKISSIEEKVKTLSEENETLKNENKVLSDNDANISILKALLEDKSNENVDLLGENKKLKEQINTLKEAEKNHAVELKNVEIELMRKFEEKFQKTIADMMKK